MNEFIEKPHGVTDISLQYFDDNIAKIGKVRTVRGSGNKNGVVYRMELIGDDGRMELDGFAWGYHGTGPQGAVRVLTQVGVPRDLAERTIFQAHVPAQKEKDRSIVPHWELDLDSIPRQT